MSWTQGIQPREDLPERQVTNLDKIGAVKFGEGYKFMAFVWDAAVPGVLYLDYQNDETKDYRSLRWDIDKIKA